MNTIYNQIKKNNVYINNGFIDIPKGSLVFLIGPMGCGKGNFIKENGIEDKTFSVYGTMEKLAGKNYYYSKEGELLYGSSYDKDLIPKVNQDIISSISYRLRNGLTTFLNIFSIETLFGTDEGEQIFQNIINGITYFNIRKDLNIVFFLMGDKNSYKKEVLKKIIQNETKNTKYNIKIETVMKKGELYKKLLKILKIKYNFDGLGEGICNKYKDEKSGFKIQIIGNKTIQNNKIRIVNKYFLDIDLLKNSGIKKVVFVGDVHANFNSLSDIIAKYSDKNNNINEDIFFIFSGDIIDKGFYTDDAIRLVYKVLKNNKGIFVMGNHDIKGINRIRQVDYFKKAVKNNIIIEGQKPIIGRQMHSYTFSFFYSPKFNKEEVLNKNVKLFKLIMEEYGIPYLYIKNNIGKDLIVTHAPLTDDNIIDQSYFLTTQGNLKTSEKELNIFLDYIGEKINLCGHVWYKYYNTNDNQLILPDSAKLKEPSISRIEVDIDEVGNINKKRTFKVNVNLKDMERGVFSEKDLEEIDKVFDFKDKLLFDKNIFQKNIYGPFISFIYEEPLSRKTTFKQTKYNNYIRQKVQIYKLGIINKQKLEKLLIKNSKKYKGLNNLKEEEEIIESIENEKFDCLFKEKKDFWDYKITIGRGIVVDGLLNRIVVRGFDKYYNINSEEYSIKSIKKELKEIKEKVSITIEDRSEGEHGYISYDYYNDTFLFIVNGNFYGTENDQLKEIFLQKVKKEHISEIIDYIKNNNLTLSFKFNETKLALISIIKNEIEFQEFGENIMTEKENFANKFLFDLPETFVYEDIESKKAYSIIEEVYRKSKIYSFKSKGKRIKLYIGNKLIKNWTTTTNYTICKLLTNDNNKMQLDIIDFQLDIISFMKKYKLQENLLSKIAKIYNIIKNKKKILSIEEIYERISI